LQFHLHTYAAESEQVSCSSEEGSIYPRILQLSQCRMPL